MQTMEILQQIIATLTAIVMALQASIAGIPPGTQLAQVSPTANISLSPTSNSIFLNNTFTVNIVINTGGQVAYGVDINRLRFNPSILQVVDADVSVGGVQISAGSLMSLNIINSVDNTGGSIQFSQLANPGSTYNGSGTLATVTFRAIAGGLSNVTFDFTLGSGADTNIAALGGDLLASVGSGSYTVITPDITAPTVPGTPSLSVISSSQINLSWTASTDTTGVTGYKVERCSGSSTCSTYSQIATPSGISYSDTGLTASTIYRYRVRAVDAAGNNSAYSIATNATTGAPPDTTSPTISSLIISNITTSGATVSWNTNESADTQVEYGLTTSYGNSTTLNTSLVTSHSVNLSGLSAGTPYHYRVKSKDLAGNLTISSNNTLTTQNLPDTTAPSVPTGLSVTSASSTSAQLSWNTSIDPAGTGQTVSGVSDYQVFRGGSLITTTASTAYLNMGLSGGTAYSYQVSAVDNAGNISSRTSSVSVTTPVLPVPVQRKIILNLEGVPTNKRNVSGTIEFVNPLNGSNIYQASFTTNTSGEYTISIPFGLLSTVTFHPMIVGYLSKNLLNVDLTNTAILNVTLPNLPAGDFNGDQLINSLDFSYMNDNWSTADNLSDVNKDGMVNSLDFAYISNNWLLMGE